MRASRVGRLVVAAATAATAAIAWAAACARTPVGPSLAGVTLQNVTLQPTAGDRTLCCCHAVGTARNTNAVPVHVTITFAAYDGRQSEPLSRILYFIKDLEPGGSHAVDAPGFLYPCAVIRDLKWEIDVKGVTYPAQ